MHFFSHLFCLYTDRVALAHSAAPSVQSKVCLPSKSAFLREEKMYELGFYKLPRAAECSTLGVSKATAALRKDGLQTVYEVIDHI